MQARKLINKLTNIINKGNKRRKTQYPRSTNRVSIARRRAYDRQRRAVPAAYTRNYNKQFLVDQLTATSARVSGSDLVYSIPDSIVTGSATNVMTVIPSNPAYWLGTRIAAIAAGYQNFRPLKFEVHYVPQVAVTQAGNVIAGTLWHDAPPRINLQQTLRTSNGGMMTQCYKPAVSHIRLQTNLQYNLYRMGGDIDAQSMPFYYLAICIACKNGSNAQIIPGYFYVNYSYEFKNPIGLSTIYYNSGLTLFQNMTQEVRSNTVAMLCSDIVSDKIKLSIGSMVNIEYDLNLDAYNFNYNGTPIDQPAGYMWIFANSQNTSVSLNQAKAMSKMPIYYDNQLTADEQTLVVEPQSGVSFLEDNNLINTVVNNSELPITVINTDQTKKYYTLTDLAQNFGAISNILGDTIEFLASIDDFKLLQNIYSRNTRAKSHVKHKVLSKPKESMVADGQQQAINYPQEVRTKLSQEGDDDMEQHP